MWRVIQQHFFGKQVVYFNGKLIILIRLGYKMHQFSLWKIINNNNKFHKIHFILIYHQTFLACSFILSKCISMVFSYIYFFFDWDGFSILSQKWKFLNDGHQQTKCIWKMKLFHQKIVVSLLHSTSWNLILHSKQLEMYCLHLFLQ